MHKQNSLAEDLKARGLIEQEAGGTLDEVLSKPRKIYLGVDPTADSLHAGNLVQILLMKRFADAGHQIYFLVGGGTGLIGDPRESGERPPLDEQLVKRNAKAIELQLSHIIGKKVKIHNNITWLKKLDVISFLREIGKHFTVNQLIKRDIIKRRLTQEDQGISFTEFAYSLLQAYDFWYLFKKYGINLQVGGSDQWANIISGVELIRKREGQAAYALTTPIVTDRKSGKKFGKSEGNAVWLDTAKTDVFSFYQFWLNTPDESVEEYLKFFTLFALHEIEQIMDSHEIDPASRTAQIKLAFEVTKLVHSEKEAREAEIQSARLFSAKSDEVLSLLKSDAVTFPESMLIYVPKERARKGLSLVELLIESGLASSKREARQLISSGAVNANREKITDLNKLFNIEDFANASLLLKKGKRDRRIIRLR